MLTNSVFRFVAGLASADGTIQEHERLATWAGLTFLFDERFAELCAPLCRATLGAAGMIALQSSRGFRLAESDRCTE
jgi:hypothetical protein